MNTAQMFPDTVEEFMEQNKMVDVDHVYSNGIEFVPIFRMEQWFEHLQQKPITNADRIRAMTDEELAEWITKIEFKGRTLGWSVNSPTPSMLTDYWLYWMKQEAE